MARSIRSPEKGPDRNIEGWDCATSATLRCYVDVMMIASSISNARRARGPLAIVALVCSLTLLWALHASNASATSSSAGTGQASPGEGTQTKANPSATLEECLAVGVQAERAATFAGEMASIPGSARMEMRIDVLERLPHELVYHLVSAPGLGVWRRSAPEVKTYDYIKQVTNLAAPASYRGEVEFRWLNDKDHPIKSAVLFTSRCRQPAPTSETQPPSTEPPVGTSTEPAAKPSTGTSSSG
jgi:hypothetical protein